MSKTFQPDSLHPYIMDARLKKATGSGGISNIPIASADTLGGIKVPADSGFTIDADGAISGVAYSTTEHKTGRKWIDGKDIYEISYAISETSITAATTFTVAEVTGIDTLVDGVLNIRSDVEIGHDGGNTYIDVANGLLKHKPAGTWNNLTSGYVTIQYTKTN